MKLRKVTTSGRTMRWREKRLCPYVVLCGSAKVTTRNKLHWATRVALANGEHVGYVDPCVRPAGHLGEHILGTMHYDPAMDMLG